MLETPAPTGSPAKKVDAITVGQLTDRIQDILEHQIPPLWVEGEISNLKPASSGHVYLTLKDERAQIQAVMFRSSAQALKFKLENGLKVLCFGQVTVYGARGQYQLKVSRMQPAGIGDLALAFEQLKAKLQAEGLFEAARKRKIPYLPRRIGIVTSPTGAAVRDLITVLTRRFASIVIMLCPVKVQGQGSAEEIAQGIARLNQLPEEDRPDVLIVGRGGGSIEDLWAFNEEVVARAIAASGVPIISAVGHEVDFTIADFVADLRAPTPSAAAEMAVPELAALQYQLESLFARKIRSLQRKWRLVERSLTMLMTRMLFRRPRELVENYGQRLDDLTASLAASVRGLLTVKQTQFVAALNRLEPLSPLSTMARGYSIVTKKGSRTPLTDGSSLKPGDRIDVRFSQGEAVACRVEGTTTKPQRTAAESDPGGQTRLPGF